MRPEVKSRIDELIHQKITGYWKDGWVYGRLCEEYRDLQHDELNYLATRLKYLGWNNLTKEVLEEQWQTEKTRWLESKLFKVEQQRAEAEKQEQLENKIKLTIAELRDADPNQLEASLIRVVCSMNDQQKQWLAHTIYEHFKY